MSAKLIKNSEGGSPVYVSFALPAAGMNETAVMRAVMPPNRASLPAPLELAASTPQTLPDSLPASALVEEARLEAARLIAESRAQAATIESQARARGLAEAHAAVAAEVDSLVEPLREQLAQTLAELEGLRAGIAARAERELVRLALEMARKIVQREVAIDHEIALTLARIALSRVNNRAVATVRLHPDDYLYVNARGEQLETNGSIEIVADKSVGRGGCLVQTEMGDVDARIEQQFAELERNFLGG